MLFSNNKMIHGLDIGNYSIKLVSILAKKKSVELKKVEYFKLEKSVFKEGILDKKNILRKKLDDFFENKNIKKGNLSCSVANEFVVIKNINLPYMEKNAVIETLKWEFEDHLPFSSQDSVIDYMIKNKVNDEMEITAVLAPLKIIESYEKTLASYNLKTLNIEAAALLSVLKFQNINSTNLIIDIGFYSTKLIVGNSKNIFFTRNLKFGANELSGLENYNSEIDKELYLEELKQEVKRAFRFYNRNNSVEKISNIYLTGGGAYINNIRNKVKSNNIKTPQILNPFEKLKFDKKYIKNKYNSQSNYTEYSIAFGLCLSEVYGYEN
ncbi:MAG: pilus assembly protein PilM [Bacillota bacterium]